MFMGIWIFRQNTRLRMVFGLSRWVYNQKRLLQSGSEKLSEEQKKKLKELLGYYVKISA